MHEQFKDKGFEIVSISLDSEKDRIKYKQFIKDNKMDWLHIMDGKGWQAELATKHGIHGIPAIFLIDPKGVCVGDSKTVPIHDEKAFATKLEEVIKATPPTMKGNRKDAMAQKNLDAAEQLVKKKDYAKAIKAFEKLATSNRDDEIGKKAAERVKELKADKTIALAIANADADKNAPKLIKMAGDLVEAGKLDKAREYYRKVVDRYPGTKYADDARNAMEKLSG